MNGSNVRRNNSGLKLPPHAEQELTHRPRRPNAARKCPNSGQAIGHQLRYSMLGLECHRGMRYFGLVGVPLSASSSSWTSTQPPNMPPRRGSQACYVCSASSEHRWRGLRTDDRTGHSASQQSKGTSTTCRSTLCSKVRSHNVIARRLQLA